MKTVRLLIIAVLTSQMLVAQIPQKMSFQGLLRDANGNLVNATTDISFSIRDAETGGNSLWQETQSDVTISNGIYNVTLGESNGIDETIFDQPLWLQITVDGEALEPRVELTSSAFAFGAYSLMSDNHVIEPNGNVGIGTTSPSQLLHLRAESNAVLRMQDMDGRWDFNAGQDFFLSNENGEEVLTIFGSTGDVVIGNSMSQNLSVNGDVSANTFSGDGSGLTGISSASIWTGSPDISYTAGKVGIGTDAPATLLHIVNEGFTTFTHASFSDSGWPRYTTYRSRGDFSSPNPVLADDVIGQFTFYGNAGTGSSNWLVGANIRAEAEENFDTGSPGTNLHFGTDAAGDATADLVTRMTIAHDGQVGIGTEDPFAELHILAEDDGGAVSNRIENTSANGFPSLGLRNDNRTFAISFGGSTSTFPNTLQFYDGAAAIARMSIDPNGFVGIGTETPEETLHIESDSDGDMILREYNNSNRPSLNIQRGRGSASSPSSLSNSDELGRIRFSGYNDAGFGTGAEIKVVARESFSMVSGSDMVFSTNPTGQGAGMANLQERMTIGNDGSVTINSLAGVADIGADGSGTLQAAASDPRLKNILGDNHYGLDFVNTLGSMTIVFRYKEAEFKDRLGWNAAAVMARYPDFTGFYKREGDDFWLWASKDFLAPLYKGVAELSAEVEDLKTRIAELEKVNQKLQTELSETVLNLQQQINEMNTDRLAKKD